MQELIKTLIKQGDYIIQAFKRKDEVIFRAESIPEYFPVVFKNLVGGQVYEATLTNLCGDLEIVGIENDLPFDDDSQNIAVATNTSVIRNTLSLGFVENGKTTHQIQITTHGEEPIKPGTFLRAGQTIKVQVAKDVNSVTLWCKQVYLNKPICVDIVSPFSFVAA